MLHNPLFTKKKFVRVNNNTVPVMWKTLRTLRYHDVIMICWNYHPWYFFPLHPNHLSSQARASSITLGGVPICDFSWYPIITYWKKLLCKNEMRDPRQLWGTITYTALHTYRHDFTISEFITSWQFIWALSVYCDTTRPFSGPLGRCGLHRASDNEECSSL